MQNSKSELIELKKQIEEEIKKKGTNYIETYTLNDFFDEIKYKEKSFDKYFISASVEEKRTIIGFMLNSELKESMEILIIKLLNMLNLERREQLDEVFNGIEEFLTDNIEENVVIMKLSDRWKRLISTTLKFTILGTLLSITMCVSSIYFNSQFLFYTSFLITFITALLVLAMAMSYGAYQSALNSEKTKQEDIAIEQGS